jgi:alanine racemase
LTNPVYRRALALSKRRIKQNFRRISKLHSGRFEIIVPEVLSERFIPVLSKLLDFSEFNSAANQNKELRQVPLAELLGVEGPVANSSTQAIWLVSHVLGTRCAAQGEAVSYGGTYVLEKQSQIGLIPAGFADGIDRKLSGQLTIELPVSLGRVIVGRNNSKALGRIAMDSISIDLSKSVGIKVGQQVNIFGPKSDFTIFDAATFLGISASEVALRLGERAEVILCR